MSDQLFEVAFSGQISAGADLAEVKARVGKMFNADETKLAQLFSGKRIVIKKNIDEATAAKYRTALNRAGAECEVNPIGGVAEASPPSSSETPVSPPSGSASEAAPAAVPAAGAEPAAAAAQQYESGDYGEVAPPPQTDPLGITGDQIEDLSASLAPVGSELQNEYEDVAEPQIDISGMDIAPVGSDLSDVKNEPEPPPPDTSGITMAD